MSKNVLLPVFLLGLCVLSAAAAEPPGGRQLEKATFAGGCFWCMEEALDKVEGVVATTSGYTGGKQKNPTYEDVSAGVTGHAESVKITYDPSKISYADLLKVFFSVAHDPTQLNRQGPDVGPQYRSAIFYADGQQREIAQRYIDQLNKAKVFAKPVVTQVSALEKFYPAEDYHQNYLALHPTQPYIVYNDLPKVAQLKKEFPSWYR